MITQINDDVDPPFGPLFTRNFPVMVGEYARIADSVRRCPARSTLPGDTITRGCALGAVLRDDRGMEVALPYGESL